MDKIEVVSLPPPPDELEWRVAGFKAPAERLLVAAQIVPTATEMVSAENVDISCPFRELQRRDHRSVWFVPLTEQVHSCSGSAAASCRYVAGSSTSDAGGVPRTDAVGIVRSNVANRPFRFTASPSK